MPRATRLLKELKKSLAAAWAGFMIYAALGEAPGGALLGVVAAMATGAAMAALHAWLSIGLRVDQIISGTVVNLLAMGVTGYLYRSGLTIQGKLSAWSVPFLAELPGIGPLFRAGPITWLALLLVVATHGLLFHSAWGEVPAYHCPGRSAWPGVSQKVWLTAHRW